MKSAKLLLWSVRTPFALVLLTACLPGCAVNQAQVILLPNRDIAALSADDIVGVMRRGGFSDERILDLGTDLRNMLASSGAAKIRVGDKIEAIFAVDGRCLHVTSRLRGSFIYDLKKRTFR